MCTTSRDLFNFPGKAVWLQHFGNPHLFVIPLSLDTYFEIIIFQCVLDARNLSRILLATFMDDLYKDPRRHHGLRQ